MNKKDIFDLSLSQVQTQLSEWQEPSYRAGQVLAAAWSARCNDFSQSTALPLSFRKKLNDCFFIPSPWTPVKEERAADHTLKILFHLDDGLAIESVAIPKDDRLTFCLSTQVGCSMGCSFCATAKAGFKRNLTAGEIIGQIRGLIARLGKNPTNLVFMGMGEPLQNLPALRTALGLIAHSQTLHWSPRKTIVSTSGWLPGLDALLADPLPAKLAFSLNAADPAVRSRLMPVNQRFPMDQILIRLRKLSLMTSQPITIEYVLIHGVNDRVEDARSLSRLLKNYPVKINLIPYNPVLGTGMQAPSENSLSAFLRELRKGPHAITLRTSRGKSIHAACGQLAGQRLKDAA